MARLAACLVLLALPLDAAGPASLPQTFTVEFRELAYSHNASMPGGIGPISANSTGSWSYDWPSRRWLYEHGPGYASQFCSMNNALEQRCRLHFTNTSDMIVEYQNGTCCSLCTAEVGCSIMRPDWLTHGGFTPVRQPDALLDGKVCTGYARPGADAEIDAWFTTNAGLPCVYFEEFHFPGAPLKWYHNITFDLSTYKTDPIPDAVFALPDRCRAACPKRFPHDSQRATATALVV